MIFLIILDLFWAGAALWVDLPKLADIPPWAWPVVIICPVYPLLLAIVWRQIMKGKKPNQYILAFGALGAALFGILAIVFYPLTMIEGGWNWRAFGQIFWVWFYSAQGWYLIFKYRIKLFPALVAFSYFLIKFTLDYRFKTFGYLDFSGLSDLALASLYIIAVGAALLGSVLFLKKKKLT